MYENRMEFPVDYLGRVLIPKQIRDAFQMEAGDSVKFYVNDAGQIVLEPPKKVAAKKDSPKRGRKKKGEDVTK